MTDYLTTEDRMQSLRPSRPSNATIIAHTLYAVLILAAIFWLSTMPDVWEEDFTDTGVECIEDCLDNDTYY